MWTDGGLPVWLSDGHSQTILPALLGRRAPITGAPLCRERWITPDGDFIDVDRCTPVAVNRPLARMVLFHGLEGSSESHYARAFRDFATAHGVELVVPHFRGCSGEINIAPRAYHSGDHVEIDWIVSRLSAEDPCLPLLAVGVSLGGNALMHWVGLKGWQAQGRLKAVACLSAPLDLTASGLAMGQGFNRRVYTRVFLGTMVPKALRKLEQHPRLFSEQAVRRARTLYEFDNAFTAPVHGFRSVEDYWLRASAKPLLQDVGIPSLVVNALNDPFVPSGSLPGLRDVSPSVTLWQPQTGGHVGFPSRSASGEQGVLGWKSMPYAVGRWLLSHVAPARSTSAPRTPTQEARHG